MLLLATVFLLTVYGALPSSTSAQRHAPGQKPVACGIIKRSNGLFGASPLLEANLACCSLADTTVITRCLTLNRHRKIAADACSQVIEDDWTYAPYDMFDPDASSVSLLLKLPTIKIPNDAMPSAKELQQWQMECCNGVQAFGDEFSCFARKAQSLRSKQARARTRSN